MKKTLLALCCAVVSFSALAKTELTVYTIIEPELLNTYKTEFEKANPDIEINWIRDSTGVITAKLLAEKENPKADVAFGVAASSLLIFDKEGMLLPYKPKGYDLLSSQMKDDNTPPHWVVVVK